MTGVAPSVGAGFKPAPTTPDRDRRRRRALRLKDYDYSQAGAYFVTLCTHLRECIFGSVDRSILRLSDAGLVAKQIWNELPVHYPRVSLDAFIVMPNHVHGVIMFSDEDRFVPKEPMERTPQPGRVKMHALPEIVRAFKTFSARAINKHRHSEGESVWQRNYYEHVVRDEKDLNRIRQYIADNPARWSEDSNNPVTWPQNRRGGF